MFMWSSMLMEGSELNIEVQKKRSQLRKIFTRENGPMLKANIKFDDLREHLSSGTRTNCEVIFTSIAPNLLREFSQLRGKVSQSNSRITAMASHRGTLSLSLLC